VINGIFTSKKRYTALVKWNGSHYLQGDTVCGFLSKDITGKFFIQDECWI